MKSEDVHGNGKSHHENDLMEMMREGAEKLENDPTLESVDIIPGKRRLIRKNGKNHFHKKEIFVYKRKYLLLAN